jgi:hypothetical protein
MVVRVMVMVSGRRSSGPTSGRDHGSVSISADHLRTARDALFFRLLSSYDLFFKFCSY